MARRAKIDEVTATAYHEAGHGFTAWRFRRPIRSLTIIPSGTAAGEIQNDPDEDLVHTVRVWELMAHAGCPVVFETPSPEDLQAVLDGIARCLAGPVAQDIVEGHRDQRKTTRFYRQCARGGDRDLSDAYRYARALCQGDDQEADALVEWLQRRTHRLLSMDWAVVEQLAAALLKHRYLDGPKAEAVCQEAAAAKWRDTSSPDAERLLDAMLASVSTSTGG